VQKALDYPALVSRFRYVADELTAGCDPEFYSQQEELEREFAEASSKTGRRQPHSGDRDE
jgi:hypothetical protein